MPDLSRLIRAQGPLRSADQAGDAVRRVIRAYHGSPHSFDRFDASKIGTGEGSQAYGHGLYFGGNEAVARVYRDLLAKRGLDPMDPLHVAALWSDAKGGREEGIAGILAAMDDDAKSQFPPHYEHRLLHQRALDHLRAGSALPTVPRGHMYEVEIDYPEESLLDYNRPFSSSAGATGAEVLRQDNPAAISASALRAIQDGSWRMESFAGRSPYETAAVELTRLAKTRGGAQALMDAGVPGIRYLDQGSRSAGEGTRNYVMFPGTEDRIRILRKYGLLAPMGAGMMGEQSADTEQ